MQHIGHPLGGGQPAEEHEERAFDVFSPQEVLVGGEPVVRDRVRQERQLPASLA